MKRSLCLYSRRALVADELVQATANTYYFIATLTTYVKRAITIMAANVSRLLLTH
jgi:hypothetical protein